MQLQLVTQCFNALLIASSNMINPSSLSFVVHRQYRSLTFSFQYFLETEIGLCVCGPPLTFHCLSIALSS